mmetsp:Transcript_23751/g.38101  ORF Transcript_23751/g.38101 Transcript_23751/m.38101 type:complete len:203 (-) Transcript_23751:520-1128(-)
MFDCGVYSIGMDIWLAMACNPQVSRPLRRQMLDDCQWLPRTSGVHLLASSANSQGKIQLTDSDPQNLRRYQNPGCVRSLAERSERLPPEASGSGSGLGSEASSPKLQQRQDLLPSLADRARLDFLAHSGRARAELPVWKPIAKSCWSHPTIATSLKTSATHGVLQRLECLVLPSPCGFGSESHPLHHVGSRPLPRLRPRGPP